MKKLSFILAIAVLTPVLASAQSSGNFTYGTTGNTTGCVLLSNGALSGGVSNCSVSAGAENFVCTSNQDCLDILGSNSSATCNNPSGGANTGTCQLPNTGTAPCNGMVQAGLKTNSGQGNVFAVTVSAVIGLLTDVTVSSKQQTNGIASSSALAGIDMEVDVTPENGQAQPFQAPSFPITFDSRFIQISTNLFSVLSTQCTVSATLVNGCFLTFGESTVSAHSFQWIVGGPGPNNPKGTLATGQYGLTAKWGPSKGFAVSGIGEAAACVGPVNLTVQQNKIFSFNTLNSL
jgi:hypothetical protein